MGSQQSQGGVNPGSAIDFINSTESNNSNHMQKESNRNNHVLVTFTWTLDGNNVFVTGTFTNWTNHIPLQRDGHVFSTTIELQRGEHHYKFIVDGDWRLSPEDPTKPDAQGNINNYIDTTNYKGLSKNALSGSKQTSQMVEPKRDIALVSFEQFDEQAKKVPSLFTCCSYLDEKDTYFKGRNVNRSLRKPSVSTIDVESANEGEDRPLNLQKLDKEDLVDIFDSPHSLTPPTHVVLNHVAVKKSDRSFNVYAVTHRFKSKYTTYKFYVHQRKGSSSMEF